MLLSMTSLAVGHGRIPVVAGIDGVVGAGETVALTGCNGSGKSTLLKTLAGRLRPMSGAFVLNGCTPADVGYLAQTSSLNRDVPLRVGDFAASGLFAQRGMFAGLSTGDRASIATVLEQFGLAGHARTMIGELSGGQFQRLSIARLVLARPRLILLDEPFTGLDAATGEQVMELVNEWAGTGCSIIAALHHGSMIPRFSRQLALDHSTPKWVGEEAGSGPRAGRLRLVAGDSAG